MPKYLAYPKQVLLRAQKHERQKEKSIIKLKKKINKSWYFKVSIMKSFLFKEFCLLRECGEIVLSEGKKFFWVWKYEKKLSLAISLIFTLEFEKCIFF